MSVLWIVAKQLNHSHWFLKHWQHLSLQNKLKKPKHSLPSSPQSNPSKPSPPTPPRRFPLPWSALTQSDQRGAPRAVRPTVARVVHHSHDTRSTHKTQSRKEESRDRGRDWTHSRHQRKIITANAVSYPVGKEENDRLRCRRVNKAIFCGSRALGCKPDEVLSVTLCQIINCGSEKQ